MLKKFLTPLVVLFAAPLVLVQWPAACTPHPGATNPAAAAPSDPSGAGLSFVQPALAHVTPSNGGVTIADVAERVTPSVVSVVSSREAKKADPRSPFRFFGPSQPRGRRESGLGSGVIVAQDGVVLTNHHVIAGASEITVSTADGREFDASIVGSDEKSDLAVLKLKGDTSNLKPLTFGDSSRLRLGEVVLAIGNPFGVGQTVTMGIVSAKGRADVGIVAYEDFIQTDAAINPGNSGGALVNMRGELVGVNTAILSRSGGYQGIGFAIPASMAKPIMASLLTDGRVSRGFLGIEIQDLDADLAKALGVPDNGGVVVARVRPGSAAERGQLKSGDVIVAVDGQEVETTGRLRNLVASRGAGKTTKLKVLRARRTLVLSIKLGELPDAKPKAQGAQGGKKSIGLSLRAVSPEVRERLDLPKNASVIVGEVQPGSRAARAGLRAGDVLLRVNKKVVRNVKDAANALRSVKGSLLLLIIRRGASRYVAIPAAKK